MTARYIAALCALLAGCAGESSPDRSEAATTEVVGKDEAADLAAEQKSIEEAADAAARLIEEETREEIAETALQKPE